MNTPSWTITAPPSLCGIYHLIRADRVVYVGQTTNILDRLGDHALRIDFDRVEFFPCAVEEMNHREEADLARLRPALNRIGVTLPYRVTPGQVGAKRAYTARMAERRVAA